MSLSLSNFMSCVSMEKLWLLCFSEECLSLALRSGMAVSGAANYEIEVPCNSSFEVQTYDVRFGTVWNLSRFVPSWRIARLKAPAQTPAGGAASYSSQLALSIKP